LIYGAHNVFNLFRYPRSYEIRIYTSASSSSIASEEKHPFIPLWYFLLIELYKETR